MATKKKSGKKTVATKPKAKVKTVVKYRYVTRKQKEPRDQNPLGDITPMVKTGMGAIIGIGIARGIADSFK